MHQKNMPRIVTLIFLVGVEASATWHSGLAMVAIVRLFVDSQRLIAQSKSDQMCEIRLTKLPYVAQQVGIVYFYAVTEIKGLSCRLRWMDEWRNLLTSTHVGHQLCHVGSRERWVTKIWVQGASATNWFPQVNGVQDNGLRLYNKFQSGKCS